MMEEFYEDFNIDAWTEKGKDIKEWGLDPFFYPIPQIVLAASPQDAIRRVSDDIKVAARRACYDGKIWVRAEASETGRIVVDSI